MLMLIAAACVAVALTAKAADVKENYEAHCKKCHGEDGKGETKMGKKSGCKDYTDAKVQAEMTDAVIIKATAEGITDSKTGKERMKAYKGELSDAEIKEMVGYIRKFKS